MSDFDERARAAADRIRRDAAALAAVHDPMAGIDAPRHMSGHRHRRLLAVAASMAVVAAGVIGLLAIGDDGERTDEPVTPPAPPVPTTAPSTVSTVPGTSTLATPATTEPEPEVAGITQPIIDPALCTPLSASDPGRAGLPRDPGSSLPLTMFARPSELPIPIQVIADPDEGQAKPFAVVLRYFDSDRPATGSETVTINGADVGLSLFPNGNGEVVWNMIDGSQGYLRSRGLDRDQLIAIVSALRPRPADAAVPGFDYGDGGPSPLELVVDQMNTDGIDGRSSGSWCRMTPNLGYQVTSHQGDDLYTYAVVIDRVPPLDVAVVGDTVIQLCCWPDPAAPTAADVVQADDLLWRQLLLAEAPFGVPTATPVGEDVTATVDLVSFDVATPTSTITLRRTVQDGIAFLEVDTSAAVLAEGAEYWKIEIDGRIRLRTSAGAGGVMGSRLGEASSTDTFTVAISATDGDDITVQTTAQILLQPS